MTSFSLAVNRLAEASRESLAMELRRFQNVERGGFGSNERYFCMTLFSTAYDRFNDAYRALRIQMTESRRTADESIQTFGTIFPVNYLLIFYKLLVPANMVSLVLREMTLNVAVERMEAIIGILFDEGVECDHCANMRSG